MAAVTAAAVTLAFVIASCGGKKETQASVPGGGGAAAAVAADKPDFDLKDLDGNAVRLSALRGNVVIVDFWATWCGPCRMALPHLQEINDTYGAKGVKIVAIAMDDQGASVVRPFVEKNNLRFTVALPDGKVADTFGPIRGYPTTIVIAPDGTVYKRYLGLQPPEVLLRDIAALKPGLIS